MCTFFVVFLNPVSILFSHKSEEYKMPVECSVNDVVSTINSRLQKLCSVDVGAMSQILPGRLDVSCWDNAINAICIVQDILQTRKDWLTDVCRKKMGQ